MSKIAVAQIKSSTEKTENLRAALDLIKEAQQPGRRADRVPGILNGFLPASQSAEELSQIAETTDGAFVSALRDAAKAAGIAVLATIYEPAPVANRVYDSAVWIDARGNIASVYRKLHLYDAFGFKESDKFYPGTVVAPPVHWAMPIRHDDLLRSALSRDGAHAGARRRECVSRAFGLGSRRSESGTLANDDQSARAWKTAAMSSRRIKPATFTSATAWSSIRSGARLSISARMKGWKSLSLI